MQRGQAGLIVLGSFLIVLGSKSKVKSEANRGKKRDHYWLKLLLHVSEEFLLEFNFR